MANTYAHSITLSEATLDGSSFVIRWELEGTTTLDQGAGVVHTLDWVKNVPINNDTVFSEEIYTGKIEGSWTTQDKLDIINTAGLEDLCREQYSVLSAL